mmetsp:Transcript_110287/g.307302  ORF Transcript_110287/g.307302 Transcript_110287/m.307302 type:complete len:229 (-) Transcript_110287:108-794(-)
MLDSLSVSGCSSNRTGGNLFVQPAAASPRFSQWPLNSGLVASAESFSESITGGSGGSGMSNTAGGNSPGMLMELQFWVTCSMFSAWRSCVCPRRMSFACFFDRFSTALSMETSLCTRESPLSRKLAEAVEQLMDMGCVRLCGDLGGDDWAATSRLSSCCRQRVRLLISCSMRRVWLLISSVSCVPNVLSSESTVSSITDWTSLLTLVDVRKFIVLLRLEHGSLPTLVM